ncbi:hypothetical protein SUGI_1169430 [Cryptomeria japonica]|nr:hypothetical protein SUGI_1169430 [Cryptomeria japonica]
MGEQVVDGVPPNGLKMCSSPSKGWTMVPFCPSSLKVFSPFASMLGSKTLLLMPPLQGIPSLDFMNTSVDSPITASQSVVFNCSSISPNRRKTIDVDRDSQVDRKSLKDVRHISVAKDVDNGCQGSRAPRKLEYMVKTTYHNFGKGDKYKEMFGDMFGDSVLFQNGEPFKQMNKSIALAFASLAFRNKTVMTLSAAVHKKLIPLLSHAVANNIPLDMQDVFRRLAFDNTCMVGFGIDPASLDLDLPTVPFLDAFDGAIGALLLRAILPRFCWKMMKFLRLGSEARLMSGRAVVYEFVDGLLRPPLRRRL